MGRGVHGYLPVPSFVVTPSGSKPRGTRMLAGRSMNPKSLDWRRSYDAGLALFPASVAPRRFEYDRSIGQVGRLEMEPVWTSLRLI
jgi:hypothetical protein